MTSARFVFLAAFLMGSAAFAHADGVPVDPVMDVSDPSCTSESGCPNPIPAGQGFQFTTVPNSNGDGKAGGIFEATNMGGLWTSLLFRFNTFSATEFGPVSCTIGRGGPGRPFDFCEVLPGVDTTSVLYNCDSTGCGIPFRDIFTINLNDLPLGTGSWPRDLLITAFPNSDTTITKFVTLAPNPMPEPATLTLLGIGLGALAAKRRFRSQRQARS